MRKNVALASERIFPPVQDDCSGCSVVCYESEFLGQSPIETCLFGLWIATATGRCYWPFRLHGVCWCRGAAFGTALWAGANNVWNPCYSDCQAQRDPNKWHACEFNQKWAMFEEQTGRTRQTNFFDSTPFKDFIWQPNHSHLLFASATGCHCCMEICHVSFRWLFL